MWQIRLFDSTPPPFRRPNRLESRLQARLPAPQGKMALAKLGAVVFICGAAFCQTPADNPKFEIADVHVADKLSANFQFPSTSSLRGTRYEFRHATMVDLVNNAYGVSVEKVLDGPSWIEMDKFDIFAKAPADTKADAVQKRPVEALVIDHIEQKPLDN
jgi:hypothetical protein